MTRARRGCAAAVAVVAVLSTVSACGADGSDGVARALEDDGFTTCLEQSGAIVGSTDDLSAEEQLDVWAEPGALLCAVDELDAEQRRAALEPAFSADADRRDAQLDVVLVLAREAAAASGEQAAIEAVGTLLDAAPLGEREEASLARRVAAAGILAQVEGLPRLAEFAAGTDPASSAPYLAYDRFAEREGLTEVVDRLGNLDDRIRQVAES